MININQDEKVFWQRDEKDFFGLTKGSDQAIKAIRMLYGSSERNGFSGKVT
jgi:hypothetical protein